MRCSCLNFKDAIQETEPCERRTAVNEEVFHIFIINIYFVIFTTVLYFTNMI